MAENQAQEPVVVVISNEPPSTKQQLTTAAISIGTALAFPIIVAGGFAVAGGVGKLARKMKRTPAPVLPDTTDDLPDTQE